MRGVALVTGGSRGIGRACVRKLAHEGMSVVFFYRASADAAGALQDELRGEGLDVQAVRCDVADPVEVTRRVGELIAYRHHVDVLVNDAGVSHVGLLTDMTDEQWDRVFDVNVKGAFHMCRAVLPGMISRRSGSIVNIASMWGQTGASCEVCYSASKAALIGLTKALAAEVGPSGVRVNCVSPGVIDTDMNAHLTGADMAALRDETPLGRIGTPEDVARAVWYLAGPDASFVTGQVLGVNGGFVI